MKQKPFSLKERGNSFRFAFEGIRTLWNDEHNARIHAFATVFAIALGFYCDLLKWEWCVLLTVISLVWIAELFNTALENLCDLITMEKHPMIKKVKDVSAAAVLIASCLALILGLFLFLPTFLSFL